MLEILAIVFITTMQNFSTDLPGSGSCSSLHAHGKPMPMDYPVPNCAQHTAGFYQCAIGHGTDDAETSNPDHK